MATGSSSLLLQLVEILVDEDLCVSRNPRIHLSYRISTLTPESMIQISAIFAPK
jgi:hypothetical protein